MFSVNIDKLANMTETEESSYKELVQRLMDEYKGRCQSLAIIGGGVNAFKMAAAIMKQGNKVLFIDGDMTSEIFLGRYKLGKDLKGITDLIKNDTLSKELVCATNYDGLNIIFTGTLEDNQIVPDEEKLVQDILEKYKKEYDFIVVDSDNKGLIAKYCDGTLVIIDEGDYSEISSQNLVNELDDSGCKVLGVIINE